MNFPVSENFNDNEMDYVVSNVIVPFLKAKKIDLLIIQAGADMLHGDPQSRISLSNNAYWKAVRDIQFLCENIIILGGGGYNPYLTAKAWAGNWVLINNKEEYLDQDMKPQCYELLKSLNWSNRRVKNGIPNKWINTWRDEYKMHPVGDEILSLVDKMIKIKKI